MTKAKVEPKAKRAPKAAAASEAPLATAVPETAKPEPEVVFSAMLTVAQVQRQGVRLNVGTSEGPVQMAEAGLNFNRALLPPDYEPKDGREYTLVITRVK